jgi:hypothetical protein
VGDFVPQFDGLFDALSFKEPLQRAIVLHGDPRRWHCERLKSEEVHERRKRLVSSIAMLSV